MSVIPRKVHGYLDYIVGVLLIAAPWVLGFADEGGATVTVPVVAGVIVLLSAMMTRYELGVVKVLPFSAHLTIDVILGVLLAASPWLLDYNEQTHWPHVVVGIGLIAAGLLTRRDNSVPDALKPNA